MQTYPEITGEGFTRSQSADGRIVIRFDSLATAIRVACEPFTQYPKAPRHIDTWNNEQSDRYSKRPASDRYMLGWSMDDITNALASNGRTTKMQEIIRGVESVREQIEQIMPRPIERRRRRAYGLEIGTELEPTSVVRRDPNAWSEMQRCDTPRRVIRIGVNIACLGKRRPDELLYRGAVAVIMADIFTARGHSVQIDAIRTSDNLGSPTTRLVKGSRHNANVTGYTQIKPTDAPMDLTAVALACCALPFFRRVILPAHMRLCPLYAWDGGGSTIDAPADVVAAHDIFIDSDVWTLREAIAAVRRYSEDSTIQA